MVRRRRRLQRRLRCVFLGNSPRKEHVSWWSFCSGTANLSCARPANTRHIISGTMTPPRLAQKGKRRRMEITTPVPRSIPLRTHLQVTRRHFSRMPPVRHVLSETLRPPCGADENGLDSKSDCGRGQSTVEKEARRWKRCGQTSSRTTTAIITTGRQGRQIRRRSIFQGSLF